MEHAFFKQTQLGPLLETLRLFGELHGPVLSEAGVASFAALDDLGALRLDYGKTRIPPKKYLFPFREELLQYRDGIYRQSPLDPPNIVLFGVHPCDLAAIAYLDRVFLAERPEPAYALRRERLTLVGVSCEPDDFCFCSQPQEGGACDLFLTPRKDGFQLAFAGAKGAALAEAARGLLSEARPEGEMSAPFRAIPAQDPQLRFSDHPLWQKFALTCVSCGACSVCCPTCYCFDLREYPSLDGGGTRLREWDNCLFATHGEVAGANFRASRLDRLRYRFLHKYCGFSPLEGMSSCVGCGRCKEVCPVDIDLRELCGGPDAAAVPPAPLRPAS